MKARIALVTLALLGLTGAALYSQEKDKDKENKIYTGYLVDIACASVHRYDDSGWGVTHHRKCLDSPESHKAGFALLMPNGRILKFDAGGNTKAIETIKKSKRDFDWRIEVSGNVEEDKDGQRILVKSLRLLD